VAREQELAFCVEVQNTAVGREEPHGHQLVDLNLQNTLWPRYLLEELGFPQGTTEIEQDDRSTMYCFQDMEVMAERSIFECIGRMQHMNEVDISLKVTRSEDMKVTDLPNR
jgi:hypothetical protein